MKHVFIFDPKAFFNQQWKMDNILDVVGQFFRTQDKPDFSIQFSRYRRHAIYIIQEEAGKAKPDDIVRIYAVGGKGILFDCLNGVAHFPNMQLVAVPSADTNDFLQIFGENAAELFMDVPSLINGEALSTDIINWGVNYALNSCYIGMNSTISQNLKNMKSSMNKISFSIVSKLSFFLSNILSLFDKNITSREYKILVDDVDYSGRYCLVHVANGPYYNGKMTGVNTATPNDGLLDIALIKSSHPLKTLFSIRKYSRGKRPKNCVFIQGKKISVHSDSHMWIQLDNEYIQDTSVNLSLVRDAVQMVVAKDLSYPMATISAL